MSTSSAEAATSGESEWLRSLFALHAHHLETSPVMAHWTAAGVSTMIGCTLASVRGIFVASTQPHGVRLETFLRVSRGVAPLYIIPFVLGSQLDCYEVSWAREGRRRAELGGVADLG